MTGRNGSSSFWIGGSLAAIAVAALIAAEKRRPLRRQRCSKLHRDLRNLAVAGMSAATLRVLEKPVVEPLSQCVERHRWGLLQQASLPRGVRTTLAVMLMDYTLYVWHVLTHRSPWLWRLHVVHHCDLDMDASTAIRFHFAEMAASVPWRAAQVALIGVGPRELALWQRFTFASILFHHSNLRLPFWLERRLQLLIVTPRMHGVHHSIVEAETNSNWSSGLTIWDRLHGTLKLERQREEIAIGVAGWRDPSELTFPKLMTMPLRQSR